MDCSTGQIHRFADIAAKEKLEEQTGTKLLELSEKQAQDLEPLSPTKRKGAMRNAPCVCGSGKKFKKCCWDNYL